MPRLSPGFVFPLLALAAAALAAGGAHAFEVEAPELVGDATFFTFDAEANARGEAVVVYTHPPAWGGNVEAALYSPGVGWGAPAMLQVERNTSDPFAGIDAQGNAYAVWTTYNATEGALGFSLYTPGAGWSAPARIDNGSIPCLSAGDLVVEPSGAAVLLGFACGSRPPFAIAYASGSGWSPSVEAPTSIWNRSYGGRISGDGLGNYLAAWIELNGSNYSVRSAPFDPVGLWGAATEVAPPSNHQISELRVALTSYGDAIALWELQNGGRREIWANRYWTGVGWSSPSNVQADPLGTGMFPQLAVVHRTDLVGTWSEQNGSLPHAIARRWSPSTGWGAPRALDGTTSTSYSPHLDSGPDGNATAVWIGYSGSSAVLRGARALPNGKWTAASEILYLGSQLPNPLEVFVDGTGNSSAILVPPGSFNASMYFYRFHSREFAIRLATQPTGLLLSVDGVLRTAPFTQPCIEDEVVLLDAPSPQVSGATRQVYVEWLANTSVAGGFRCYSDGNATASFRTEHRLDVTSAPANATMLFDGANRTAPFSEWLEAGTFHYLDGTPPPVYGSVLYRLVSWSDGGAANHSVLVDQPIALSATYAPAEYAVAFLTNPPGLSLTLDGFSVTAPSQLWWVIGSHHTVAAPSPQNRSGDSRFAFANWSDGGAAAHGVDVTAPLTLTSWFVVEWRVTVTTVPDDFVVTVDGASQTAPAELWLANSTIHLLGAPATEQDGTNPSIRYGIDHWSAGAGPAVNLSVTQAVALTATFVPRAFRVDLTADADGVNVLVNGTSVVAPAELWWAAGNWLLLGADSIQVHGRTRYSFSHWSDGGPQNRNLTIAAPLALKAFFALEFELTVDTEPSGGNVTIDGVTYAGPKSVWGAPGVPHTVGVRPQVALSASARLQWSAWSDGGAVTHDVAVGAPTDLTALYGDWFLITLESERGGVSCDVPDCWYASGTTAALRAVPYVGGAPGERFAFLRWTANIANGSLEVNVTIRHPYVVRADWAQQFLLETETPFGEVIGGGWYTAGTEARVRVNGTTVEEGGRIYHFARWEGDASASGSEVSVAMNAPRHVRAVWEEARVQSDPLPVALLAVPAAALLVALAAFLWKRRGRA